MSPSAHEIARFRADFERALRGAPQGAVALAVSGGPDSMAMLELAAAAYPDRVISATVDHGLRRESAEEARMVASACATLGVPHATLPIVAPRDGNLHAWARRERYALLESWAVEADAVALCTAHHADDQAETLLMRAARAAGLAGLAGVRTRNEAGLPIIRPLLSWRRAELRRIAEGSGLPFVDDPSNDDPRFDRARFRQWLAQAPWLDPRLVARSAEHLAEAEADLQAISDWVWSLRTLPAPEGEIQIDVADLPRGLRRYLARKAIETVSGQKIPDAIESLLDTLDRGKGGTRAGVQASAKSGVWRFRRAPPRRPRQSLR